MTGIIGHWYRVEISEVETCFNGGLRAALADLTIIPRSFDGADPVPMRLYHIKDGYLYTPRHWGTQHFGAGKRITTLPKPALSPYPKIPTPRVGQEQFFNDTFRAATHYRMFSVKAATGAGKTLCALQTIARLGVEALIVVPTDALIRQWVRQIEDKLGLTPSQIGRVQQDKCDYVGKHITVASMQSLYSRDYGKDFYRYHGFLVMDELHTLNAQEMSRVLGKFYADVQIGQTATHKRKDGRDKVTELWFGKPAVVAVGAPVVDVTVTPVVIQHQQRATSMSRNVLVSILAMNQHRTARLAGMLNRLYTDGKVVLGISDSVKQLQIIHAALISQYGIPAEQVGLFVGETYTGNDKLIIGKIHNFNPSVLKEYAAEVQEHFQHMEYTVSANTARFTVVGKRLTIAARNAICAKLSELSGVPIAVLSAASAVRQEKKKTSNGYVDAILQDTGIRIYLATYGVMAMGVDVPWLDAGIDLTPRTEPEQVLGRVRRQYDGKKMAHWFSPVDKGFSRIIENINSARLKAYTAIAGVHLQGQRG